MPMGIIAVATEPRLDPLDGARLRAADDPVGNRGHAGRTFHGTGPGGSRKGKTTRYHRPHSSSPEPTMNRQKKIKQLLKAHAKKASAKLAPRSTKPKYISKADREKLALQTAADAAVQPEPQA